MSEIRTRLATYLKQVRDTKRPLVITQHGKSIAVLLDVNEYETMQAQPELLQELRTSVRQLENGLGIPHQEARDEALQRLSRWK